MRSIFKDDNRIDQQVRGGCFGRQQLVQCGFSSRTCHTGDASRFTYESGDTLLHLGNRNASSPAFLCELLAQGASIHAKNSKGETAEELDKNRMREAQRLFKLKPRAKKKKVAKKVEGNQSARVGAMPSMVGVANRGTKLAKADAVGVAKRWCVSSLPRRVDGVRGDAVNSSQGYIVTVLDSLIFRR